MFCIIESVVTVNVWQQSLIFAVYASSVCTTSQKLTNYQALSIPFSSHFFPVKTSDFRSRISAVPATSNDKDTSDEMPVKPSCEYQKTVDKDTKGTVGVSDKAGEAKGNGKECQRMLRKAAVYQGYWQKQLDMNAEIFPFRGKCHMFPCNFQAFHF